MRTLTATLLAAQRTASRTPCVKVEVCNRTDGVVRLGWERLYTGTEVDYYHAVAMPGDGSLIRARLTIAADGLKLYRQRVANPGPLSDFSTWVYTNQYDCSVVAAAALGTEAVIFWINSSREVRYIQSTDSGVTWSIPQLIDYSPTPSVYGLAAAYKPNGDLAIFFADMSTLCVKKRIGGTWQEKTVWDKTTGDLSGVATVYDGDWMLLVTGRDSADNRKLWSPVYGDGGAIPAGTWSGLKEIASAAPDANFEYGGVFLDKPDVFRCFYVEKCTGAEAYSRPFWSYSVPGTGFLEDLWHEPVPFDLSTEYGVALSHHGSYAWLTTPGGVWRAGLAEQRVDLTPDIVAVRQESGQERGELTVTLRNGEGQYTSLAAPLAIGSQVEASFGYVTGAGSEVSTGPAFTLEAYEHARSGGHAALTLFAPDGRTRVNAWRARHQFRWNQDSDELSVKQILELILARVGLRLEVKSESAVITGYYPDFIIRPGDRGESIMRRLLSFVPDVLFIEGNLAFLVNPLPSDSAAYAYGVAHQIAEGRYRGGAWETNRVRVEGRDPATGDPVLVNSFSWGEIEDIYDRPVQIEDREIGTVSEASARGQAYLREAEIAAMAGLIRVPVNCGQQLYDVIEITDASAGLSGAKRRVVGITTFFDPARGRYEQQLLLGAP